MNAVWLLAVFCFLRSCAYYNQEAGEEYKWWIRRPAHAHMLLVMRNNSYIKKSNVASSRQLVRTMLQSLNKTNTHAYGLAGGKSAIRLENLYNFSNRLGLLHGGPRSHSYRYIDIVAQPIRDRYTLLPRMNSDHRGRIIVAEGHLRILQKFLSSRYAHALIFEDDVTLMDGFTFEENMKLLDLSINKFNDNRWDILYLGFCFSANYSMGFDYKPRIIPLSSETIFVKSYGTQCLHGYLVNRQTAKILQTEVSRKVTDFKILGIDTMFATLACEYDLKAMRLNLPIFDQDRTLSVSSTQGSLHFKKLKEGTQKKLQEGVIKFELHPFIPRESSAVHWVTKICGNRLKASNHSRFADVKEHVRKATSHATKIANEAYFYIEKSTADLDSNSSGETVLWRPKSPSEQLVVFPVSCYMDTFLLNLTQCHVPVVAAQFLSESTIVLKRYRL